MSKKTKILYFIIGVTLIGLLAFGGYKFYQSKTIIEKFGSYIEEYKKEISMYDLIDKESEYTKIITESEQALSEKKYKLIPDLKERAELLKEELLTKNIEIAEDKIAQLENIDISKLDNKDSINSSIEELKKLKESHNFIKVNEIFNSLSEKINVKITEVEEIEKQKKREELLKNIDGVYEYSDFNKNEVQINNINISLISYNENKVSVYGEYNYIANFSGHVEIEDAVEEDIGQFANSRYGTLGGILEYKGDFTWSGYIWDDRFLDVKIQYDYNNKFLPTIPITIIIDENGGIATTVNVDSHIKGNYVFSRSSDENINEYLIERHNQLSELKVNSKITVREAYDLVNQHSDAPKEGQYEELDIYDYLLFGDISFWNLPDEEYYTFAYYAPPVNYIVGKESGLVYYYPNQLEGNVYLMKNGEIEKTYEWNNEAYEAFLE